MRLENAAESDVAAWCSPSWLFLPLRASSKGRSTTWRSATRPARSSQSCKATPSGVRCTPARPPGTRSDRGTGVATGRSCARWSRGQKWRAWVLECAKVPGSSRRQDRRTSQPANDAPYAAGGILAATPKTRRRGPFTRRDGVRCAPLRSSAPPLPAVESLFDLRMARSRSGVKARATCCRGSLGVESHALTGQFSAAA